MEWTHKVNPEWLEARRRYLTASDIMKLLPTTPTGRARVGLEEALVKVWAKKQCAITDSDITSTGVMARGHLLEPYAIDALNNSGRISARIHHWDDCLVYSKDGIACSPDGLNYPPLSSEITWVTEIPARVAVEVKCYNAETHYLLGMSPSPGMLLERWQLATAFYVMPTLEIAALVFFNPSANHPLFVHHYLRVNLAAELAAIEEIGKTYCGVVEEFTKIADEACDEKMTKACPVEQFIIDEILEKQAVDAGCLNP